MATINRLRKHGGGDGYSLELRTADGKWLRWDEGDVERIADVLRHNIAAAHSAAEAFRRKAHGLEQLFDELLLLEDLAPNVVVLGRFSKRSAAERYAYSVRKHDGEFAGRPVQVVNRDAFWDVELLDLVPMEITSS